MQSKNPQRLVELRIAYSEKSKLLSSVNKLIGVERIYPTHLPTQSSFRWSTMNPALTNFPRECINPDCPDYEHEWEGACWSLRDIVMTDTGMTLVTWDYDNVEGRLHDLYLNDTENLTAHALGHDLHTITCCHLFHMALPSDLTNPHSSLSDVEWRATYRWQGKDTQRRVMAKNFNHGWKYTDSNLFVYQIPNIEKYGLTIENLLSLADEFIALKGEVFARKKAVMKKIARDKVARNMYGAKRVFYPNTSSRDMGKDGFSFVISSTVSFFNDETLILMKKRWPRCRLIHNCHDGDKVAFYNDEVPSKDELSEVIERKFEWEKREVMLTAGIKIYK